MGETSAGSGQHEGAQARQQARHFAKTRLEAHDIVVFRGERLVLDGVDLDCGNGEALLLVGPNGAGKSTLLRVLAGFRAPDAGTLLWNGTPVTPHEQAGTHARRIAYLGHQDALKPGLSLHENLRLACVVGDGDLSQALVAVGLSDLGPVAARLLSAGQKRRAALARVLLHRGAILWLLDEPSLGLDAEALELLGAMVSRHRACGGMVIAATHQALPMPDCRTLALGQ